MPVKKNSLKEAYRVRELKELNRMVSQLNKSKTLLNTSVQFYLENFKEQIAPPIRLCRALAVPGFIGAEAKATNKEITNVSIPKSVIQVTSSIWFILKQNMDRDLSTKAKSDATLSDANELGIYMKMYHDIHHHALPNPSYAEKFPNGNPFRHILDMVNLGGVIIRFKYISTNNSVPAEKIISYHPMRLDGSAILGVHVEGDKKFSMSKRWGEGDEKLKPLYKEYQDRSIRHGKEDVLSALIREKTQKQFLY